MRCPRSPPAEAYKVDGRPPIDRSKGAGVKEFANDIVDELDPALACGVRRDVVLRHLQLPPKSTPRARPAPVALSSKARRWMGRAVEARPDGP